MMYSLTRTIVLTAVLATGTLIGCEQQGSPDANGSSMGERDAIGGSRSNLGRARDAAQRTVDRLEDRQRDIGEQFDDLYE